MSLFISLSHSKRPFDKGGPGLQKTFFRPFGPQFDYCDAVWGDCSKTRADKLKKLQNSVARIIASADYTPSDHQMC